MFADECSLVWRLVLKIEGRGVWVGREIHADLGGTLMEFIL